MKFKNVRDVVYCFKDEQTLKKFIWEQVGSDFILDPEVSGMRKTSKRIRNNLNFWKNFHEI